MLLKSSLVSKRALVERRCRSTAVRVRASVENNAVQAPTTVNVNSLTPPSTFVLENGYPWEVVAMPALASSGRAYTEHHRIKSHEVGPNRKSSLMTISNILQVRVTKMYSTAISRSWMKGV